MFSWEFAFSNILMEWNLIYFNINFITSATAKLSHQHISYTSLKLRTIFLSWNEIWFNINFITSAAAKLSHQHKNNFTLDFLYSCLIMKWNMITYLCILHILVLSWNENEIWFSFNINFYKFCILLFYLEMKFDVFLFYLEIELFKCFLMFI